jgi:N-acetylmuramoyl-L-alanine amidase
MRGVAVVGLMTALMGSAAPVHGLATLRAVRHIPAPTTTRLIVEFSEPVEYRLTRLPARPDLGVPARLYVDTWAARVPPAEPIALSLARGPLLRVRTLQLDPATTRLILDVPGLREVGVFPMPDPFRLVIDVRGAARPGPPLPTPTTPAAPQLAAPAPPVPPATAAARRRRAARRPPPGPTPAHAFKVVIDPGHGGKDPGALGVDGVAEKDVVLAIALRLQRLLRAVPGLVVVLTRTSDVYLALEERTARANLEEADLFVSIHANASTNTALSGVETYYLNNTHDRATLRLAEMENGLRTATGTNGRPRDVSLILSDLIQNYKVQESVALASQVQRGLVGTLAARWPSVNNLGVKRGPFYVLVGAGMPCVLAEVSFITHPTEGRWLAQADYQDHIALGLLRGITRFIENARTTGNV